MKLDKETVRGVFKAYNLTMNVKSVGLSYDASEGETFDEIFGMIEHQAVKEIKRPSNLPQNPPKRCNTCDKTIGIRFEDNCKCKNPNPTIPYA